MLMEEDDAKNIVAPYVEEMRTAMHLGWQTYSGLPASVKVQMTRRAAADSVHDFQVHQFRLLDEKYAALRSEDKSGLYLLIVDEKIALRLKKFDHDRLSCNNNTNQNKDFRNQQSVIPGIPVITNLELGYSLDILGQEIEELFITCPSGLKRNYWEWGITEESAGVVTDMFAGELHAPGSANNRFVQHERYSDEFEEADENEGENQDK